MSTTSAQQRSSTAATSTDHVANGQHSEDGSQENGRLPKMSDLPMTPIPWRQLSIICLMRLSEPIGYSVIFPFVSDFIWDLGTTKDRSELGLYAGIIESLFALTLASTVFHWARASDRYGRRPILLFGLIGSSLSAVSFGLSTSFPKLVCSRCISGALNGNVAIYKSVVGEITDRTNVARSLSFLALMFVVGMSIGPMIGGQLSRPAIRYPSVFSHQGVLACGGIWERFPYFLPCLVAAAINWISALLGASYLNETAPAKLAAIRAKKRSERRRNAERERAGEQTPLLSSRPSDSAISVSETTAQPQRLSVWGLLKIRHIRMVLISYACLALLSGSFDAVQVLYFWEPIMLGGMSFPATITGSFLSFGGVFGIAVQLGIFPFLQRRWGTLPLYRTCILALMVFPLIMPWASILARIGLRSTKEHHPGGFWQDVREPYNALALLTIGSAIAIRQLGGLVFLCNMILVNQSAALVPGGAQMGTLNGLAQMTSAYMFALGPYTSSTLFAFTLEHKILGGFFIWVVLFSVGISARIATGGILNVERMVDEGEITQEAANQR